MVKSLIWIAIAAIALGSLALLLKQCEGSKSLAVRDELNASGVRPDVAAEIAKAFPESEKKRAASTQLARAFQASIETPDKALEINELYERAQACLDGIEGRGRGSKPTNTGRIIRDWVVNTTARSRAYIRYNAGLSGRIFEVIRADIAKCDFDPSKMPN